MTVTLDGSQRRIQLAGEDLESLRLAYAQHVYRQQGATVERSVVLTGGWQTSKETAYVEATRARHGTDWFIARDDLGERRTGRRTDHPPCPEDDQQPRAHPIPRIPGAPRPRLGAEPQSPTASLLLSPTHWLTRALNRDTPDRLWAAGVERLRTNRRGNSRLYSGCAVSFTAP